MTARVRLGVFLAALVVGFGLAVVVGQAVDPADRGTAEPRHADTESEHAAGPAEPAGLSASVDGLVLEVTPATLPTGETATLALRIRDAEGRPIQDYDVEQERELHLVIVRRDLSTYQHLHPARAADGTWSVPVTLPDAGVYRAFADFSTGGERRTLGADITAAGSFQPQPLPAPTSTVAVAGYDLTLTSESLAPAQETGLTFAIERDGEPAALDAYLGARGHLVVLRAADLAYLHAHAAPVGSESVGGIAFEVEFPSAGTYRAFVQFASAGAIRTAAFTLDVAT